MLPPATSTWEVSDPHTPPLSHVLFSSQPLPLAHIMLSHPVTLPGCCLTHGGHEAHVWVLRVTVLLLFH